MRRAIVQGWMMARATSISLVATAALILFVSIIATVPGTQSWVGAATFSEQLLLPVALAGSAFLGIAWRLQPSPGLGWLTAATTMIGIQAVPMLALSHSELVSEGVLSSSIAVGVTLVLIVKVAESRRLAVDPLLVGVGVGLVVLVMRGTWSALDLVPTASAATAGLGSLFLLVVGALLAVAIRRRSTLPLGRTRLAIAVLAWTIASALGAMQWTERPGWAVVAICAGLLAGILSLSTSVDLLRRAIRADQEAVLHLQQQLHSLRGRVEQLHEVKGTIAGIASATDLIRHEDRLTSQHRDRLEEMLAQEAARLQRLVHMSPATRVADLDDIVQPLVLARQVQGQQVEWRAPDVPVASEVDELAEVINILLHNAGQHAPGSPVTISTRMRDGRLELVVADTGDGVPTDLRHRIFEWGYSSDGSSGQGVGLALARRMMARHGCDLRLDEDYTAGAAFVLALNQPDQENRRAPAGLLIS